jgi:preprotein translocase subunit SecG
MLVVLTIVHVIACTFLIGIVLLQQGKGADMGAVFGGSSSTIFGSSGAGNFLTRLTTGTAIVFMVTSLGLTYLSARSTTSTVFDHGPLPEPPPLAAPAQPGAGGAEGAAPAGAPPVAAPQGAAPQAGEPPAAAPEGAAPQAAAPQAAEPVPAAPQPAQPQAAEPQAAAPQPAAPAGEPPPPAAAD